MKADYVHKDTLTATDYVELNKNNELLMSYNQVLLKEKQELKKQVEEWEHHLKCSKEMLDIQGQKGNYDYDEYMLGLYNGMEYIISLFETREPNYISGKDVEFTNNKTQQQEFILYLRHLSNWYSADGVKQGMVNEILQKYKEIIGGNKDE